MTRAYFHRMHVRGTGRRAGWLETFVEILRGTRLSMTQCRQIACAYAEAARHLQSCGSKEERNVIVFRRNQKILETVYGDKVSLTIQEHK